jgi:hypothetical protein
MTATFAKLPQVVRSAIEGVSDIKGENLVLLDLRGLDERGQQRGRARHLPHAAAESDEAAGSAVPVSQPAAARAMPQQPSELRQRAVTSAAAGGRCVVLHGRVSASAQRCAWLV